MLLRITELLEQWEYPLFRLVMFIIFLYCLVELLDKHIPIKAPIKKLLERIFPSIKL
jgi:hypothetical protein